MTPDRLPPDDARPAVACKILTSGQWAGFVAAGSFAGAPVDLADGYIHLSAMDQVAGTLAKHFAGQTGLVLATIDLAVLGDTVRWEVSRGGALFPHVYGVLPMSAVTAHRPIGDASIGDGPVGDDPAA